ncbi:guanine nucleotide binding protein, alpha subunit [Lanmaoa asiatica]|nr:guanine nucleotide binding protein, alpha subunit [Lanmaoa asiatica]
MGNCISAQDRAEKARSDAIDRQLEEDSRKLRKECKILLLGSGESGKSTIVKQMKIIHQNGFTDEERMTYRPTIYRNTLDSAQAIVLAMRKIGFDCIDPSNRVNADRIFDYRIDPSPSFVFSSEIAEAIHQLWKDPIIPKLMDHASEFYLMDSAVYFFTDVLRIGSPNYLPTESDVLRARLKTTGITETRFTMGQLQYVLSFNPSHLTSSSSRIHMFDVGGQRSERKKWIHCFESVTSIIFCTALSEYDQVLLEEKNQASHPYNRMAESLILFESVINSRWFLRTSIILFLNKIDVFKTKLPKVPLEKYFPEYSGGADINKAAKYILWRFMQTNRARLSVYPHLTQATDTTNIRLVFAAVKETILQNALKDSGIL